MGYDNRLYMELKGNKIPPFLRSDLSENVIKTSNRDLRKLKSDLKRRKTYKQFNYKIFLNRDKKNLSITHYSTLKKIRWIKRILIRLLLGWELKQI